nr:MAG TPA: hypothetical protein [Caudoviricetes sp.]
MGVDRHRHRTGRDRTQRPEIRRGGRRGNLLTRRRGRQDRSVLARRPDHGSRGRRLHMAAHRPRVDQGSRHVAG